MAFVDTLREMVETIVREVLDEREPSVATAEVAALTTDGVRLRYLSKNLADANTEARVASIMAGDQVGAFFRPEVGTEVVVAFENGDLSDPIVVGCLHNDDHAPPSQADRENSNNIRALVSRAGHELTFDDSSASGGIKIRTASGAEILLEDGGKQITITTAASVADTRIVLDGVSWNHQHATGVGPSGPPVSITPVT